MLVRLGMIYIWNNKGLFFKNPFGRRKFDWFNAIFALPATNV
jgi:hypothetical protein